VKKSLIDVLMPGWGEQLDFTRKPDKPIPAWGPPRLFEDMPKKQKKYKRRVFRHPGEIVKRGTVADDLYTRPFDTRDIRHAKKMTQDLQQYLNRYARTQGFDTFKEKKEFGKTAKSIDSFLRRGFDRPRRGRPTNAELRLRQAPWNQAEEPNWGRRDTVTPRAPRKRDNRYEDGSTGER